MDKTKLSNILTAMEKENIRQLLISDPAVIFYLTGNRIEPGERMLVLLLKTGGDNRFFINDLDSASPRDLGSIPSPIITTPRTARPLWRNTFPQKRRWLWIKTGRLGFCFGSRSW